MRKFFLKLKLKKLIDQTMKAMYSRPDNIKGIDTFITNSKFHNNDVLLTYMAIQIASHQLCSIDYYLNINSAINEILANARYKNNIEWNEANLKIHKSQSEMSLLLVESYFYKGKTETAFRNTIALLHKFKYSRYIPLRREWKRQKFIAQNTLCRPLATTRQSPSGGI